MNLRAAVVAFVVLLAGGCAAVPTSGVSGTSPHPPTASASSTVGADSAALAGSEDTPTVAFSTLAPDAAPSIPGATGWYREKRVGAQEVGPGGTQSTETALDLTESSFFRYPGVPSATGADTAPGDFVDTPVKPGGSSVYAHWLFNLEFVAVNTRVVQLRLRAPMPNPDFGMLLVNGHRVQMTAITTTINGGEGYAATLTFPTVADRVIKIYGLNGDRGRFGGVAVDPNGSVAKPVGTAHRRVAFIGDSFTDGANGVASTETFVWDLARSLKADEVIQAGIGGTGFARAIGDDQASLFRGRLATVLAMKPDVLIVVGGRNDDNRPGLGEAVSSLLRDASGVPEQWVMSQDLVPEGNASILSGARAAGVPAIDLSDHRELVELSSDGVHPTFEGHRQLAALCWQRMQDTTP